MIAPLLTVDLENDHGDLPISPHATIETRPA
jgi:hypothetical protein